MITFIRRDIPAKVTFFPSPGVQQTRRVILRPDGSVFDVDKSEVLGPEFFTSRPRMKSRYGTKRCRNGHKRTKANTRIRKNGRLECRVCSSLWQRRWRERQNAQFSS